MPAFRESGRALMQGFTGQQDLNRKQQEEQQLQQAMWQIMKLINPELSSRIQPNMLTPQTIPMINSMAQRASTQRGKSEDRQREYDEKIEELKLYPGSEEMVRKLENLTNVSPNAIDGVIKRMTSLQDKSQTAFSESQKYGRGRTDKAADTAEQRGYTEGLYETRHPEEPEEFKPTIPQSQVDWVENQLRELSGSFINQPEKRNEALTLFIQNPAVMTILEKLEKNDPETFNKIGNLVNSIRLITVK